MMLKYMCDLIKELKNIHNKGMIYGDRNPGNILYDDKRCKD